MDMETKTFSTCRFLIMLALIYLACASCGQPHHADYLRYLGEQNAHFATPEESPLLEADLRKFAGLNYYDFAPDGIVEARWERQEDNVPFEMPTSTERRPMYVKMGELHFVYRGDSCTLSAYQNLDYVKDNPEEASSLFIPFNDLTNGVTTYGGGRYMDMELPESTTTILDFNRTYHPYCAYNHKYSCPIPPDENVLDVAIEAGVKSGFATK